MKGTEYAKYMNKYTFSPKNKMVENWLFVEGEEDIMDLADAMAVVAKNNGIKINELSHIFPMVLRMLKSQSEWSK